MDSNVIEELDVFRNILDSINSGVALLDNQYTLLYINSCFNTLLEKRQQSLLGTKVYLNKDLDIKQLRSIHAQIKRHESWQGSFPEIGKGLKANILPINFTIPASLAPLSKASFILTISDDSEALRQQHKLLELDTLLKKSDNAKSNFFSQMTHELRTPLNAILGYAQLLKMDTALSKEQQEHIQEISSSGDHLLTLINETLDLSKAEQGSLKLFSENINLHDLISECITLVSSLAQKHNIEIIQHHSTLTLLNDRVRLKQVLINLLSNAIKYNNERGKVIIHCFLTSQCNVHIEIQDSGTGLTQHLLDTIFTPFERLDNSDKQASNTGLGLMITRRLVKKMNGSVNVLSELGSGSIFSLEFPNSTTTTDDANALMMNDTRNVLWIGDEPNKHKFAKSLTNLRPQLKFHHESNIDCALQHQAAFKPDLIFLTLTDSLTQTPLSSPNINFLLKNVPIVAVITNESLSEGQLDLDARFVATLSNPMKVIDFMDILDRELCQ